MVMDLYAWWSEVEPSQNRKENVSLGYITGDNLYLLREKPSLPDIYAYEGPLKTLA